MAHLYVDSYTDYAFVLHRDDGEPSKDERFIERTFLACEFDSLGGDEMEFRHRETSVVVACDGEAIAVQMPTDPAVLEDCYQDLMLALHNLEWQSGALYCVGDADEMLDNLARYVPGHSVFDLKAGVRDETGLVEDLRNSIHGHASNSQPSAAAERSVRIADLDPSVAAADELQSEAHSPETATKASIVDHASPATATLAADTSARENPPATAVQAAAPQVQRSAEATRAVRAPVSMPSESAPMVSERSGPQASHAVAPRRGDWHEVSGMQLDARDLLIDQLLRENEAHRRLNEDLTAMLKQQMGRSTEMERFAAAVVPENAILIAHVPRRKAAKLSDLGFALDYNVWAHEEYGALLDGAFLVFTRDDAPPEWVETLMSRLGGVVARLWQSGASMVGTLLEQFVQEDQGPALLKAKPEKNDVAQVDPESTDETAPSALAQGPEQGSAASTAPVVSAQQVPGSTPSTAPIAPAPVGAAPFAPVATPAIGAPDPARMVADFMSMMTMFSAMSQAAHAMSAHAQPHGAQLAGHAGAVGMNGVNGVNGVVPGSGA
ncbi:hypothetical protein [Burkholderia sp. LMG 13014]|uniref:hypothetical protein n=1 Tax=Burkholderia sp. LMG 13014 TaxID=2709306 RepID=UPI0019627A19|nr:hypothetical protein [Burkholderia sp. LMG 13014]